MRKSKFVNTFLVIALIVTVVLICKWTVTGTKPGWSTYREEASNVPKDEETPSKDSSSLNELLSVAYIETTAKEFEQKFEKINEYSESLEDITNVELYLSTDNVEGNHLILVELSKNISEIDNKTISSLTLIQTVLRSETYKSRPSGGRSTTEVFIGYELYDMIILSGNKEVITFVDGELLSSFVEVELFKSLTKNITLKEFEDIMVNRVPFTEQIEYRKSEDD